MTTHFLPNRAMNYGLMGFLIAKDILHLILPDGKQSLFCFGVHSFTSRLLYRLLTERLMYCPNNRSVVL